MLGWVKFNGDLDEAYIVLLVTPDSSLLIFTEEVVHQEEAEKCITLIINADITSESHASL